MRSETRQADNAAEAVASLKPEVDEFNAKGMKIVVSQADGFLCHISLTAVVNAEPDLVYDVLIDPDNARYFRNIEECTYRKILEDDDQGRLKVEVEHAAGWRFLMFHGRFYTRVIVNQDKEQGRIEFELLKPGMMKKFHGIWNIKPLQETEDPSKPAQATLVELEQSLLPNFVIPPPFRGLIRGICRSQVQAMMEDVVQEIQRLKAGKPVPKHQQKKLSKSWKQIELEAKAAATAAKESKGPGAAVGAGQAAGGENGRSVAEQMVASSSTGLKGFAVDGEYDAADGEEAALQPAK